MLQKGIIRTLIVSDIFGRTEALEALALKVADSVEIIDPYDTKVMRFKDETEAYDYFRDNVGLEAYSQIVKKHIDVGGSPLRLIGFSIGASAIWNISNDVIVRGIIGATCFYGSQIRFNLGVKPRFPIKLVLPTFEQHFSISELIEALSCTENVMIERTPFLHGFMNKLSKNYDENGYNYGLLEMCKSAKLGSRPPVRN